MGKSRNAPRGFTLLEVMIAVAILSSILLVVALMLRSTGDVTTLEAMRNEIERANQAAVDKMTRELRGAQVIAVNDTSSDQSIEFRTPVDLDGGGTVLDTTGALEYGFKEKDGVTASRGRIRYSFEQTEILDEAALRTDVNGNGTTTDRFAIGRMLRSTQREDESGNPLEAWVDDPTRAGLWVAQPLSDFGGRIDGDTADDPIFAAAPGNNREILINLYAIHVDGNKHLHFVRCNASVFLRNK